MLVFLCALIDNTESIKSAIISYGSERAQWATVKKKSLENDDEKKSEGDL